jgi:hypothetical protein
MATELQRLNRFSHNLYELIKGNEDLFSKYVGLGIQCTELLNSVNNIISQTEKNTHDKVEGVYKK